MMIAVVDDDEGLRNSIHRLLRSVGYEVKTFEGAEFFLDSGAMHEAKCIILDFKMPGMDGLQLLSRLNDSQCSVPVILVSASGDANLRRRASEAGAFQFVKKPFDPISLLLAVTAALARKRLP